MHGIDGCGEREVERAEPAADGLDRQVEQLHDGRRDDERDERAREFAS